MNIHIKSARVVHDFLKNSKPWHVNNFDLPEQPLRSGAGHDCRAELGVNHDWAVLAALAAMDMHCGDFLIHSKAEVAAKVDESLNRFTVLISRHVHRKFTIPVGVRVGKRGLHVGRTYRYLKTHSVGILREHRACTDGQCQGSD